MRIGFVIWLSCIILSASAQQKIRLQFRNKVGDDLLQLGATYKNPFGEILVINKFRYYVSNIRLIDVNGQSISVSKDDYLIDEADSASKVIILKTFVTQISAIEFLLGVDSIRNISGVQIGALDPMHGMFWTWNSGYIMAKLEGVSPSAKVPGNLFSHHIGGFKSGENVRRYVRLNIGENIKTNYLKIIIEADINQWFQSTHNIKIADHPICHSPGNLAMQIADNYATMFKIASVN